MAFANKEKGIAYVRDWQKNHREEMRENQRRYYQSNKEKVLEYKRVYHNGKALNDTHFRLARNLRSRLWVTLKRKGKNGSAVKDLGCSISELKTYIENQFTPGMSWDKKGQIHIDHITPLSLFDLTDRNQFLVASHYTNLQPLWKIDNIKKSNNLIFNRN